MHYENVQFIRWGKLQSADTKDGWMSDKRFSTENATTNAINLEMLQYIYHLRLSVITSRFVVK